jgi:hypothetical protein
MIDVFEPIRSEMNPSKPPDNDDEHVVQGRAGPDQSNKKIGPDRFLTSPDQFARKNFL